MISESPLRYFNYKSSPFFFIIEIIYMREFLILIFIFISTINLKSINMHVYFDNNHCELTTMVVPTNKFNTLNSVLQHS